MTGAATAELYLAKVIQLHWEAENVVSLQLIREDGSDLPEWEPGAHIDVTLPSGLIRQYSLCGNPADRSQYTIAVLREEHGRGGSAEIHDSVMVGQKLWIRGPRNHFPLEPAGSYVFIAGGIGVTPILSMARKAADEVVPWSLHYGGRSLETMAFTRGLAELGARSGAAVHLVPEVDAGLLPLRTILEGVSADGAVYSCGPMGLLDALRAVASEIRPDVRIHFELFSAPSAGGKGDVDPARHDHPFWVRLARSDRSVEVADGTTVLQAVLGVRPDVPYSCEEGFCGTCITKVCGGVPVHRDTVLTEQERAANDSMLICVGSCASDELVLDL
jgi:ferredoxin-NADP reductase